MPNPPSTVLGLDPGLEVTGFGVITLEFPRPAIVEAGLLRIPTKGSLSQRLNYLFDRTKELIADHRPAVVAIEELFSHYERPRTAILMGHARGVLFLAAAQAGLEVSGYLPTRVKKLLTGSGRATKEQMQIAIQAEFRLPSLPDPPDVADALAVALCHLHSTRLAG